MHLRAVVLAGLCLLAIPETVRACDLPGSATGSAPLHTRKPLVGEDVRLATGFGKRRHPLLEYVKMHTGIDWAAPVGTPVIAAGGGQVVSAGYEGPYGNRVLIDHGGGWHSLYAHLSRISVQEGACVATGAQIGAVGNTGLTTGPALHFEVRQGDSAVDPLAIALAGKEPN